MTPSPYATLRTQGWPWRPSNDVRDPELKYWLERAEATCRCTPSLSADLVRAAKVEIGALVRNKARFNRWAAQLVTFSAAVVLGSGFADYLGIPLMGTAPWRYIASVFFFVSWWCAIVRPRISDRFAHRAVVARDRLNRWLAPVQHNCLRAAPQRQLELRR